MSADFKNSFEINIRRRISNGIRKIFCGLASTSSWRLFKVHIFSHSVELQFIRPNKGKR